MKTHAFNGAQYVDIKKMIQKIVDAGGNGGGVTDHGALTGLGDDDHPLYALKTDVSNHYVLGTDVSNHYATGADVSNHYALKTDVSNHYVLGTDVSNHYALKTDVSNHYALKTDVSNHYATGADVSNNYLPLAGGTMAGNINMGANDILNIGTLWGVTTLNFEVESGGLSTSRFRNPVGTFELDVEGALDVSGNIKVSGTVDGVDVAGLQTDVSNNYALNSDVSNNYVTQSDVSNNYVTQSDVSNNYKFSAALKFGNRNTDSGSAYYDVSELNSGLIGYRAYTMPTSGSIRGVGASWYMSAFSSSGNYTLEVWKAKLGAGGSVICETQTSVTGTGYYQVVATYDSGTYTFDASDMIILYARFEGGLAGSWRQGVANVLVDYDFPEAGGK